MSTSTCFGRELSATARGRLPEMNRQSLLQMKKSKWNRTNLLLSPLMTQSPFLQTSQSPHRKTDSSTISLKNDKTSIVLKKLTQRQKIINSHNAAFIKRYDPSRNKSSLHPKTTGNTLELLQYHQSIDNLDVRVKTELLPRIVQ